MNREPENRDQHDDQLVDSLLQSLYETSTEQAQDLVTSVLPRLDQAADFPSEHQLRARPRRQLSRPVTIALATAALILVVVSLTLFDRSSTALAAVQKSLDQALVDVGRHYRVELKMWLPGDNVVVHQSDLYVQGGDRFAWQLNTPIRQSGLWFGSENGSAWVVPPVGPVIEGGNQSLIDWVAGRQDISSPYLHVSAVLQRMRNSYQLQLIPTLKQQVPSHLADCQHVLGTLKGPRTNLAPDEVELWTDMESGLSKLLIQRWKLPSSGVGWESITMELIEEAALPDDFFSADGHGGQGRGRINFNSGVF